METNRDNVSVETDPSRSRTGSASRRNRRDLEAAESDVEPLQPGMTVAEDSRPRIDNPVKSAGDDNNFNLTRRFPYAPEFGPNGPAPINRTNVQTFVDIDGVQTPVPDVNIYQQKKTLAQGMMDIALLSANANQLRYVLESYRRHPYYIPSMLFISISLILQVAVGVGLILNSRYNVNDQREICKANRTNNLTVIGIFIVTIVNVLISAFGVANPPADLVG